ncbi:MAG: SDR family oxidoreductase [Verrucomicrobiota bacterium]
MPVALITGGEGFLARKIAKTLRADAYDVHAPSRRELDVSSVDSVEQWFSTNADAYDLVIHAAGIADDALVSNMSSEQWDKVLAVNLRGAFLISRAAMRPMLKKRSGHIIFIGSFAGLSGTLGQANYAAAKAGLTGFAKSLAKEAGGRGVRVNCVLPGFLESPMTKGLSDELREAVREAHALKRFNTGEEAAKFIAFLDTLSHVSGQVFQLDSRIG